VEEILREIVVDGKIEKGELFLRGSAKSWGSVFGGTRIP
jgi:hypothetical protein